MSGAQGSASGEPKHVFASLQSTALSLTKVFGWRVRGWVLWGATRVRKVGNDVKTTATPAPQDRAPATAKCGYMMVKERVPSKVRHAISHARTAP